MELKKENFRKNTYYINKIIDHYNKDARFTTFRIDDIIESKSSFMAIANAALKDFFKDLELNNDDWANITSPTIIQEHRWVGKSWDNNFYYTAEGFIGMANNTPSYFNDFMIQKYDHYDIYYNDDSQKKADKLENGKYAFYIKKYQKYMAERLYEIDPELAAEYKKDLIEYTKSLFEPEIKDLEEKLARCKEILNGNLTRIEKFLPVNVENKNAKK